METEAIKKLFVEVQEKCKAHWNAQFTNDFDSQELFFLGFVCGRRNNFLQLPALIETVRKIRTTATAKLEAQPLEANFKTVLIEEDNQSTTTTSRTKDYPVIKINDQPTIDYNNNNLQDKSKSLQQKPSSSETLKPQQLLWKPKSTAEDKNHSSGRHQELEPEDQQIPRDVYQQLRDRSRSPRKDVVRSAQYEKNIIATVKRPEYDYDESGAEEDQQQEESKRIDVKPPPPSPSREQNRVVVSRSRQNTQEICSEQEQKMTQECEEQPQQDDYMRDVLEQIQRQEQEEQIQRQEQEEKLNMELIMKLQQEEKDQLSRSRSQQEEQEVCNICIGELYDGDIVPLEQCEHVFHKVCLFEYLKTQIDKRKVTFKCPEEKCELMLKVSDFREVLDKTYHEKYLDYSLANFVDENNKEASWCPTAGCNYVFLLETEKPDYNNFQCPKCSKHYCLNCHALYHKGQTCKEFQISNKRDENDIKFEKFAKGAQYKQCPHCTYWVEKTMGCYKMTCKCGHTFCYTCGGPTQDYHCPTCTGKQQAAIIARPVIIRKPRGRKRK